MISIKKMVGRKRPFIREMLCLSEMSLLRNFDRFLKLFEFSQKLPSQICDFGFKRENGLCEAALHQRLSPNYLHKMTLGKLKDLNF